MQLYHVIMAARLVAGRIVQKGSHVAATMRSIRYGREFEPMYLRGELIGWRAPGGRFLPAVGGGSRDNDIATLAISRPAASAGTLIYYHQIPATHVSGFLAEGFSWMYNTTEANADNTLDWDQTFGAAGTGTTLFTNANANGLLDTAAPVTPLTNRRNAASGGAAAAAAATPTAVRIAAGQSVITTLVTAGTGTVPAVEFATVGHYI